MSLSPDSRTMLLVGASVACAAAACFAALAAAFAASGSEQFPWLPLRGARPRASGSSPAPPARSLCAPAYESLIGGTPLVRLGAVSAAAGAEVWAKLELRNPGGSNKDRVVLALVDAAEASGVLVRGAPGTLFEGSSGSTALSLAALAAARG
jgi:hypothetical protein